MNVEGREVKNRGDFEETENEVTGLTSAEVKKWLELYSYNELTEKVKKTLL